MRRAILFAAAVAVLWGFGAEPTYGQGELYGCMKNKNGKLRLVSNPDECKPNKESPVSWHTSAQVEQLMARIAALEALLAHFSRVENEILLIGANLHIRSGSGATDGEMNGLGNLIVGYNELRENLSDDRTGSHNLVVGKMNSYSSYGGMVVGQENTIGGVYSSVSGGNYNTASGSYSSVSGGQDNKASGAYSSVSGGGNNTADWVASSVSGGSLNTASGTFSSVSGGLGRSVLGFTDWAAGALFQDE